MNKNAVLLVTALVLSACTVVPEKSITLSESAEIVITAHQEGYDGTKTSLIDGGTQVYWEPGDEIKVFYGDYSSKFTSLNTEYATTASFSGSIDGFAGHNEGAISTNLIFGLYPYREDAVSDGNTVTTTLPHLQTGRAGSFAKNSHIAIAKSTNFNLAFYNVTTGIRFKLNNDGIRSVTFESTGREAIAGKFKVAFENERPVIQEIVEGQSRVTLMAPDGGTFETGKWYYIVTLPQTLENGFKVTFNRAGDKAERSTSNLVTIRRGTFLSIDSIDKGVELPIWVDLGLSVKWAARNVGAESAGEYGDYFAWGETTTKNNYSWSTYKYCNESNNTMTKYCNKSSCGYNGYTDSKTVLDLEDDAARANWGGSWRIPTDAEWTELREQCTWTWTTQNGNNGYKVTSKTNGNSIFLPAAGYRIVDGIYDVGSYGYYWSSSLYLDNPGHARCVLFYSSNVLRGNYFRCYGQSIRPVDDNFVESVSLSNSSLTMAKGGMNQITATVLPANATNKNVTWSSSNTTVATVSSSGLVTAVKAGSATITVTTQDGGYTASCTVIVREDLVDLDLSVMWASCNLGASCPEEYGDYYAWGETETKGDFSWSTYKYCNGSSTTMTKYCTDSSYGYNGFTDNKTVLDLTDDVARTKLGGSWRMPTYAEWTELLEQCTWTWTTQNGVNGYKVTSKTNGNSIFLPAAGYWGDSSSGIAGSSGSYWSSSLYAGSPHRASNVYFYSSYVYWRYDFRCYVLSVRPVYGECIPVESVSLSSSLTITEDDTCQLTETVKPANAWNKSVNWSSSNTSVATVSSRGLVKGIKAGTATIKVITQDGGYTASCIVTVLRGTDPVEVDLGLSVKWADRNIGASNPEEYGDYYAWGETEPKSNYDWSTYKYCNGSSTTMTKYCNKSSYGYNGFTDNKTVLDLTDDVARTKLGGSWRMPTDEEWTELREQCTWTWITRNGVNGYRVTSKTNGNSIFLPAAGRRYVTSLLDVGSIGYYWSSSLNTGYPNYAWYVDFGSSGIYRDYGSRCTGRSVRPVTE